MNRAQVLKSLAAAAVVLGLTSCAKRTPVLDFALKDSAGQTVKLSDYRGKVVLLNFWATWCAPCKIEIPWFVEFQQTYKNRDFVVLGVSMDEDGWDSVRPYMTAHKFNYPVVIGGDTIERAFGGVDDLPTTFLMDRDGRIVRKHIGLVSKNTWEGEIGTMLKGRVLRGGTTPAPSLVASILASASVWFEPLP
jgi:peroxiredoxin